MDTMTRTSECNATQMLLLAFELGERTWKIGFSVGSSGTSACGRCPRARSPLVTLDKRRRIVSSSVRCPGVDVAVAAQLGSDENLEWRAHELQEEAAW